jgi:hypothetical protein
MIATINNYLGPTLPIMAPNAIKTEATAYEEEVNNN